MFEGFVGQQQAARIVSFSVQAALKMGCMPDHMLFFGPPGLGKTTLARLVAQEVGARFVETAGNALTSVKDVLNILLSFKEPTVIFVDEIHRIPKNVEELLYSPMDEKVVRVVVGKHRTARVVKFELPDFTLIGATTKIHYLSKPFVSRFSIRVPFNYYSVEDIETIIRGALSSNGLSIAPEALRQIAVRCRGTPREALQLVRRLVEYGAINQVDDLQLHDVHELFKLLNVDEHGLSSLDRSYIAALASTFNGGPVGLRVISSSLGIDVQTVEGVVEPYLMMQGLVTITSRGRKLTQKGWAVYEGSIHS
ncbi:Holliday junction branch migration DNA helicase RuvB [Coprothermobacteraceae bacterium]|nr:Holliday junction branch migration DNA helicase RuvB [Coprothermobacteraceae bacterium]